MNSKPLTLEQLEQMRGLPVWCKGKTKFGTEFEGWKVVSKYNRTPNVIRFTDGTAWVYEDYGETLFAYANGPKEDNHETDIV